MRLSFKKVDKKFLYLVTFSLFVLPSINVASGIPAIRVDEILIFTWLALSLIYRKGTGSLAIKGPVVFLVPFLFLLPASILNGALHGFDASLFDLNQYVRLVKYIGCYLLTYSAISNFDRKDCIKFYKFLTILLLAISFISVMQKMNLLGINRLTLYFSVKDEKYASLLNGYSDARAMGFVGNPNVFSMLFVWPLILLISTNSKLKILNRPFFYAIVIFSLVGLLFTLSRTGLISLLVGGLAVLSVHFLYKLERGIPVKNILTGLFFISVCSSLLLGSDYFQENVIYRLSDAWRIYEDASFQARLPLWVESIEVIQQAPLLGVGPLSRAGLGAVDNEYLLLIRSYGLVGLGLLAAFFTKFVSGFWLKYESGVLWGVLCSASLMMFTAGVFFSLVLFPVLIIILLFARRLMALSDGDRFA